MKEFNEYIIEKLRISSDIDIPDIPLGEQGWGCTSINSMYNETYQADDFLKADIDLMRLSSIDTKEYTEDRVTIFDKVFQALKRRKWCTKIMNIILSEYTFEEGAEKVQEILRHPAKCEYAQSTINTKRQVIRILDSYNTPAMVLSFTKL
jgi:hypothetical protein